MGDGVERMAMAGGVGGRGSIACSNTRMVQMDCTVRCGRSSAGRYVGARLENGVCNG